MSLQQNIYQYTHDGSVALYDTMQVAISDGIHDTYTSVDFKIFKIDQAAPKRVSSASGRLVVIEGKERLLLHYPE